MKGKIEALEGFFKYLEKCFTTIHFSQGWHKGVAKGSSYQIRIRCICLQTVHCRKGTTK